MVVSLPCTGGLKGWLDPNFYQSLPRLRAWSSAKPSWFVSCWFLPYSSSNAAPIRCAPLQLRVEVCSSIVSSLIVVKELRVIPFGSIFYSVTAWVMPFDFTLIAFQKVRKPLGFHQFVLSRKKNGYSLTALDYWTVSKWLLFSKLAGKLKLCTYSFYFINTDYHDIDRVFNHLICSF